MRRRQFVSLLAGAALPPLTALPVCAAPTDGCGVPVARDDGWPVAAVSEDKLIDRGALCRMADRLASTVNVHAVLVARGGKLVFERYFKGSDEINGRRVESVDFDADTRHNIKSATKSVASLALGIRSASSSRWPMYGSPTAPFRFWWAWRSAANFAASRIRWVDSTGS